VTTETTARQDWLDILIKVQTAPGIATTTAQSAQEKRGQK